jgi:hypothetical protein
LRAMLHTTLVKYANMLIDLKGWKEQRLYYFMIFVSNTIWKIERENSYLVIIISIFPLLELRVKEAYHTDRHIFVLNLSIFFPVPQVENFFLLQFLHFVINYQHLVSKHSINKLKNVKQNVLKTLNGLELMFSLLLNHLLNWAF